MNKRADVMSLKYDGSRNLNDCRFFGIQKPRHCGGVKKSLSGEQRKEAPNVLIY